MQHIYVAVVVKKRIPDIPSSTPVDVNIVKQCFAFDHIHRPTAAALMVAVQPENSPAADDASCALLRHERTQLRKERIQQSEEVARLQEELTRMSLAPGGANYEANNAVVPASRGAKTITRNSGDVWAYEAECKATERTKAKQKATERKEAERKAAERKQVERKAAEQKAVERKEAVLSESKAFVACNGLSWTDTKWK